MRNFYFPKNSRPLLLVCLLMALLVCPGLVRAQQNTVSGTVTDAGDGSGLPGVTVTIKGTSTAVATNIDGKFTIRIPASHATLVFSFVSYKSVELAVTAGSTNVQVKLAAATSNLDEVVVIGYGTAKRSDLTGSIGSVNSEELNRNKNTDLLSALNGKVAGVQIFTQSGELGAGYNIKIRGANSLSSLTTPLYVIDGIPFDSYSNEVAGSSLGGSTTPNPLSNINPQDIESIEVLKDASATAIYGSRGANGVVLVTTKTGKVGKPSISYDGNMRINAINKRIPVLGGPDFLAYRIQRGGATDPVALQMDPNQDGIIDVPVHDWQREIYRTSYSQSHTATVSGGSKETQFSGSLGYLNDQGIILTNYNERWSGRLRVDHNASEKLKVGININFANNVINGSTSSGGAFQGVSRTALFSRPVDIYSASDASDGFDTYISPVTNILSSQLNSNTSRTIGNTYANYKITKELLFNITAGGNLSDSKGKEYYPASSTGGVKTNGAAAIQNIHSFNWTVTNQLTYNKQMGKNSLNATGVFETSSYEFENNQVAAQNFPYDASGYNNIGVASTITGNSSSKYTIHRFSLLARVIYNVAEKYLFTASIRDDASSQFGANNRHGYFPSGAFAWRVGNEKFMQNQKAVSNLKLRLSYGVTGNDKITPYTYASLLDQAYYGGTNGGNYLGFAPGNPGFPGLQWEQNVEYDAGLDFGLFGDRVTVTADYYHKKVDKQLIQAPLATQGGFFQQFENLGRIDNYGYELAVTTHNIRKKNLTWDTDFNISFDQSKVISLGGANSIPVNVGGDIGAAGQVIVGQPFGTGYGYVFDGIYQLSDFTQNGNTYTLNPGVVSIASATVQPGTFKFKDISGPKGVPDGVIDSYDQTVISHSAPRFTGGFNSNLHYKDFDFSFFLQGTQGRQVINEIKLDLDGFKPNRSLGLDFYQNRWTTTNPSNTYPTTADLNATSRFMNSYYVEDGSFLRLKSVTLAYNVPTRILQRTKAFNRLRLYVTGNDLLTWTKYTGYDPEVSYKNNLLTGYDGLAFPHTRSVIFGVTATF